MALAWLCLFLQLPVILLDITWCFTVVVISLLGVVVVVASGGAAAVVVGQ